MSTAPILFSLEKTVPICRIQLYRDVVCKEKYGPLDRVWICPGHVFVSVRDGRQLYTFDTKNTTQDENKGCLDLQNLDPPLLEVLSYDANQSVYIVQQNGYVQCWKFRADRIWILEQEFNICNSNRSKPPLVSMVIYWNQSSNSVTMYSGPYTLVVENSTSSQAFDFTSLAFKFISISIQVRNKYAMLGYAYNTQKMELTIIEEGSVMRRLSAGSRMCDKLNEVQLEVGADKIEKGATWFCHQGNLGLLHKTKLLLFDMDSGKLVNSIAPQEGSVFLGMCNTSPASVVSAVYTGDNVYVIMKQKKKEEWDFSTTSSLKDFQTTALHIAHLEQEKTDNPSTKVKQSLSHLKQTWQKSKDQKPGTKLAEIVAPYLEEYWKLENISTEAFQPSKLACPTCVEDEVLHILDPNSSLLMSDRHARLLSLAHSNPKQVLAVLESQMEFDTDDISAAQIQRWQCILAPDVSVSPVSSDVAVPMFEHICRLLYKLEPKKLMQFVKICQMINDQKVGVSAFIRKRQAIHYYERAVVCIQDIDDVVTSPDSAQAFVSLLLASKQEHCETRALQFYLDAGQWELSLDLLRDYCDNSQLHFLLFHRLLDKFNKEDVLTDYAVMVFSMMPNIKREFAQLEDRDLSIAAIQSDLQQSLLPLVKQELWYKIRYKRLSEGKEEFVPDDPKPPQQYETSGIKSNNGDYKTDNLPSVQGKGPRTTSKTFCRLYESAGKNCRRFSVSSVSQQYERSLDDLLNFGSNDRRRRYDKQTSHRGQQEGGRGWNSFNRRSVDFQEMEKNFYLEHADVKNIPQEEIEAFYKEHKVKVFGDVPRPVFDMEHVNFPDEIKDLLAKQGICKPTPIQSLMWPVALSGLDSVGIAQTGSGKTLGYMLPAIVHSMNQGPRRHEHRKHPRTLVIAPTRELTKQISTVSWPFCKLYRMRTLCLYGGASKSIQEQDLLRGQDIVVATPGRLLDLLNNYSTLLDEVSYLVLDEADRMLDMGFEPQIKSIMNFLNPYRQTTMWSATWPREVENLALGYMSNNVQVQLGSHELTVNQNIEQKIVPVEDERDKLFKFVEEMKPVLNDPSNKVLIFTNTKVKASDLAYKLKGALRKGITAIHGDISQMNRERALRDFSKGNVPILVATDVAARGIDVSDITHVVNFDFPKDLTDYIHRVGRTGRAGKKGNALSFISLQEDGKVCERLVELLRESNQEIPDDLLKASMRKSYFGSSAFWFIHTMSMKMASFDRGRVV
uniref:RNA helicase n=1 Tax=Magallana gigas TaxID=29159 RepID=K1P9J0_MAGGI